MHDYEFVCLVEFEDGERGREEILPLMRNKEDHSEYISNNLFLLRN